MSVSGRSMALYTCVDTVGLSEEPGEELRREQREAAAKDDAADLALGAALPEHEHEAAENDGDEGERAGERSCERRFEVGGGAFPWRLRGCRQAPCRQHDEQGCRTDADGWLTAAECVARVVRHVVPPRWRACVCAPRGGNGMRLRVRRQWGRGQCRGADVLRALV